MYKINDLVVYRRNVCKVIAKKRSDFTGELCYVLEPYENTDYGCRVQVPVSNKAGHLRSVVTKDEVDELCKKSVEIEPLESKPANMKSKYQAKMKGDDLEDLVCIIKTSSQRNQERMKNNKKLAAVDGEFLQKAEDYLYSELSVALEMPKEQTKEYFINEVKRLSDES